LAGQILMFDSGIGGISVFREIKRLMPEVSIDYLFDNLCYPYGCLSESELIERLVELIIDVVARTQPQLLVIACNSASTIALPDLRQRLSIPVVGVVPAIKPAALLSKSKVIGLLATQGTVNRNYVSQLAGSYAPDCSLIKVGTNELVTMAELVFRGEEIDNERLAQVCKPLIDQVDTIVLGCTHFPLLKKHLIQIMPQPLTLIDSGAAIAKRVSVLIDNKKPDGDLRYRALFTKVYQDEKLNLSLSKEGLNELVHYQK
jgi:glutamate racemase